jgi:hypothetical protein
MSPEPTSNLLDRLEKRLVEAEPSVYGARLAVERADLELLLTLGRAAEKLMGPSPAWANHQIGHSEWFGDRLSELGAAVRMLKCQP